MTVEALEAELSELQAAYELVCNELQQLKAQTLISSLTVVSRPMPKGTVLNEYLPCAKTGRMWARTGRELYEPRDCATVEMPDGRPLAFRKWSHAQAWLEAGMPEFVNEYE